MRKEDDKFDMMIRSILDEGQEEVPARVWDAINSRLDSIGSPVPEKRPKPLIIWLRNAGIGLAAATVAAAVIFSGITQKDTIYPDSTLSVVETTHTNSSSNFENTPVNTVEIQQLEKTINNRVPTSITEAEVALDTTPSEKVTLNETNDTATATSEKTAPEVKKNDPTSDYTVLDNPFDDFPEDTYERKRKINTSFTVFGNANSNSNSQRTKDLSFRAPGVPSKSTVTESGDSKYGIPVSVGIGAKLSFTQHWSMSIGLNYSFLSRTFDGNFYDVKGDGTYTNTHFTDIRNTQNYIGIPVNVYYSIIQGKYVDFYAYAGGSAEYCLSNKYFMNGTGGNFTHKGDAKSFQFSVNAGIGVEFIVAQRIGIYIDPSVRYYFRNSRAPKSIRTDQPLMLAFEAGLRIKF